MTRKIECQKCAHEHDGSEVPDDDDDEELVCESCGFRMKVFVTMIPDYATTCVEHEWREWEGDGVFQTRYCKFCHNVQVRRAPTT